MPRIDLLPPLRSTELLFSYLATNFNRIADAFEALTGTGSNVTAPTIIVKTVDEQVVSSSTLQNDDELVLPVINNTLITIKTVLFCSVSPTGDINLKWSFPTGTTIKWTATGIDSAAAVHRGGLNETNIAHFSNDPHCIVIDMAVSIGGTSGDLTLTWAQDWPDAIPTKVLAGSSILAHRVA